MTLTLKRVREHKNVLVGVLKQKRDLEILLRERWYRIPRAHLPKRTFHYLAWYEPVSFDPKGKQIRYYARVVSSDVQLRRDLLPREEWHPRARDEYVKIRTSRIMRLPHPIKNILPRRISFGFTTLARLKSAKTILTLYHVAPTEEMVGRALRRAGIHAISQYALSERTKTHQKRYYLDYAIVCARGAIAIECDNTKAHSGARAQKKDNAKDAFLERRGWTLIRLKEKDIMADLTHCVQRIRRAVQRLGGVV